VRESGIVSKRGEMGSRGILHHPLFGLDFLDLAMVQVNNLLPFHPHPQDPRFPPDPNGTPFPTPSPLHLPPELPLKKLAPGGNPGHRTFRLRLRPSLKTKTLLKHLSRTFLHAAVSSYTTQTRDRIPPHHLLAFLERHTHHPVAPWDGISPLARDALARLAGDAGPNNSRNQGCGEPWPSREQSVCALAFLALLAWLVVFRS